MRRRFVMALLGTLGVAVAMGATTAPNAQTWVEGTHYVRLTKPQQTTVPAGKVEVMEVFSYGCPGCNRFAPVAERIRHALPPAAQMTFLPASFLPGEDFPMFQRAYFAAQTLGVADKAHQGMFDAVWKTGELALADPVTHQMKNRLPTIEDAARCYQKLTGVSPQQFLAAARSFSVDMKMKQADAQILAMQVPSTPCIVVNGKYRVVMDSLQNDDQLIDLVRFLVTKEAAH
jgi:protein dithiol oxidoreductase (disulfide-forming)